ncbi:hypothetical protein MLD38_037930 [Melastoma candidum]|uniref:Uncharacterized protein n=1 Tax=Melastoma candidum TaxID=119954 RepID=A0ACB9KYB8_9MYRT|nr:hypothetical protein MLD38_037930 [Melastoma candidum]
MDTVHLRLRTSHSRATKKPSIFLLSSLLTSLCLISLYIFFVFRSHGKPGRTPSGERFSIIIDGGSTGTRVHVYRYSHRDGGEDKAAFNFGKGRLESMRINPGLSAYTEEPEEAGRAIGALIEFGRRKVPREMWGQTEIRLMVTAGLRMVEVHTRETILEACRKVLTVSGFVFNDDWATVITGSDEGVYAWVVANYALGTLGGDPEHTTGIIELGGASALVTFSSSEPLPSEYLRIIKFGNATYHLYSHSFLHFGQIAAYESMRDSFLSGENHIAAINPCLPKGYFLIEQLKLSPGVVDVKRSDISAFHSGGNFSECRSAALKLLQRGKDMCIYEHCQIGSIFTPKLNGRFLATENFFYTSKFFGLGQTAPLSDIILAGERFCGEDWSILRKRHHLVVEEDLLRYCFSTAYIVSMLHDSLGVGLNDRRIQFTNRVGDTPLDWALGAFILQSREAPDSDKPVWIINILWEGSFAVFLLVPVFIICMLVSWTVSKWKKPQLKTIYDLEKGRYIITGINRR